MTSSSSSSSFSISFSFSFSFCFFGASYASKYCSIFLKELERLVSDVETDGGRELGKIDTISVVIACKKED